ncbi:uncharacterized protein LOC114472392 [Gouania willdenowi]|uniref:Uncharacterized LOC114472392 n=1 Tax=Gouania willdenowi TaxID=441366 RepID=A0A8C5DK94_GOUWI|nr:uncharacterized protein LOC114472392 [Gouania willdenowi]
MSSGVVAVLPEDAALLPAGPILELDSAVNINLEDVSSAEEDDEEKELKISSAHFEPATLPWSEDKNKNVVMGKGKLWSEKEGWDPEERDTGFSGGSQDLSEEHSQTEDNLKNKAKWRESMPEGERWRDDDNEVEKHADKGDGSLADDEEEEEEEKGDESFTPNVMIVHPSGKEAAEESKRHFRDVEEVEKELQMEPDSAVQVHQEGTEDYDKYYLCEDLCSEKVRVVLATVAGALLFPLLVWGGFALLPFDPPLLESAPLRLIYTLRCAFFATIPILLGVVVQGVARLRFSSLRPMFHNTLHNREVAVHWHYVNESAGLFVFYFLQLAVMATYISHDLIKLVPLLTIIFAFGRLIYWLCLALGSSIRGLGFGFSFFPILVMLGVNFYFICSSVGQEAIFDVAPLTTPAPLKRNWWG